MKAFFVHLKNSFQVLFSIHNESIIEKSDILYANFSLMKYNFVNSVFCSFFIYFLQYFILFYLYLKNKCIQKENVTKNKLQITNIEYINILECIRILLRNSFIYHESSLDFTLTWSSMNTISHFFLCIIFIHKVLLTCSKQHTF